MKRDYFIYRVEIEVEVTRTEHNVLMRCSEDHYDAKCRSLCKPAETFVGSDGFSHVIPDSGMLWGWKNMFETRKPDESITVKLTWHELDLLCKVTESPLATADVAAGIRRVFEELREETKRIQGLHVRPRVP